MFIVQVSCVIDSKLTVLTVEWLWWRRAVVEESPLVYRYVPADALLECVCVNATLYRVYGSVMVVHRMKTKNIGVRICSMIVGRVPATDFCIFPIFLVVSCSPMSHCIQAPQKGQLAA